MRDEAGRIHRESSRRRVTWCDLSRRAQGRKNKEAVYRYIVAYIEKNGNAPTYKEIKDACGIKSSASVTRYIMHLCIEKKFYLGSNRYPKNYKVMNQSEESV